MERVLVVDDEPKVLDITGQILQSHGYEVTLTSSPENALLLLRQDPNLFKLIILDWKLRCAIDGDMVLKMIKYVYPSFSAPIIFVTGHTHISSKYLMRLGAYDTLTKPVTAEQLIDAVERALQKKPSEDPHPYAPAYLNPPDLKKQEIVRKIVDAIASTASLKEASEKLGCSRASLYRWLNKTGLYQFYIQKDQQGQ
ncbi:response regulator [Omnitrophica bacterium]|nr:response regulator [Candidatus Omnitrophota bacterium]